MSNHLVSEVYSRELNSMARGAVMVLMADKASDDGSGIWAAKQRMAEELNTTKQTIISTIKSLIADDLLRECGQRRCPNGYTVEYAINVARLRSLPLVKSHADRLRSLTGQAALPVKQLNSSGKGALPEGSSSLTQTPLEPSLTQNIQTQSAQARVNLEDWKPEEFEAGSQARLVADELGADEMAARLEHFIAHHAGKGTEAADWQVVWQAWVLNGRHRKPRRAAGTATSKPSVGKVDHTPTADPAAVAARKEREQQFDKTMAALAAGQLSQVEIDKLTDYTKQVAETRGHLRREPNGTYTSRIKGV